MILSKSITDNKKFPSVISNHEIFKLHSNFEKIFPYIGLKNFKCSINDANGQIPFIIKNGKFSAKLTSIPKNAERWRSILWKIIKTPFCIFDTSIDVIDFFLYRRTHRNLQVVFSSDQDEGAWDIATMAMRGISSCQSWSAGRRAHLIGSIVDPCCGIMYLTTGTKGEYGTDMMHRAIVRYVVHQKFGPCLFLEKLYSQPVSDQYIDRDINLLFACMLYRRSGLPIIYNTVLNNLIDQEVFRQEVFIPEITLNCGNLSYASYRDSGLQYRPLTQKILKSFPILAKLKAFKQTSSGTIK